MTLFELLTMISTQYDLALLPLLALAFLPALTSSLGAVGAGVAATALGAGLGAAQGAIVSSATGQDPGRGAAIGAGTGAAGAGLGSIAGAGAEAGTAAATATEAATTAAPIAPGAIQTGAQAAEVGGTAGQIGSQLAQGTGQTGFQAAQTAGQSPDIAAALGTGTDTFANAPQGGLLVGPAEAPGSLREGGQAGLQLAGATQDAGATGLSTGARVAKALGSAGIQVGGRAAQIPKQATQKFVRKGIQKPPPKVGQPSVDPVLALLAAIKQSQAQKIQERTFF